MSDNSDPVQTVPDVNASVIYISEPKTPIYVSKETAFSYVKEELQKVEIFRKAGIEEIERAIRDASQNADNHYVTLDHLNQNQKKRQMLGPVVFAGVASALSSFIAHTLIHWVLKIEFKKNSSKETLNEGGNEVKLDGEGAKDLQGDNLRIRSRRLYCRNWQVTKEQIRRCKG